MTSSEDNFPIMIFHGASFLFRGSEPAVVIVISWDTGRSDSLISVEQINGLSIVVTFRVFSWWDLELSN